MTEENTPTSAVAEGFGLENLEQVSSDPNPSHSQASLQNIPAEMRAYRQFVCWRLVERDGGKPTKLPINAATGQPASVTDPATWATFEEAIAAVPMWACSGVGFVFTQSDPFCGIDLDDTHGDGVAHARQMKLFQAFNSYSELSPSGKGLHIIIKADLSAGKRRGHIEIYSSERYFTMTGNVYRDAPIEPRQELASTLWAEMGGEADAEVSVADQPECESDETIIERASNAKNRAKFKELFSGNWQATYRSQSEADLAFVNIVAFYTKNRNQIARIYRKSVLGQSPKNNYAHRGDYVDYVADLIKLASDQHIPEVKDASTYTASFAANFFPKGESKSNVFSFSEFTNDSRPPSYIWHRVFQIGYLYTITGMWGGGKTALAITVAIHAALGLSLCGHGMVASKVLILCGENPDDARLRIRAACAVFAVDPASLEGQLFFTRLPFAIDNQAARDAFITDAVARISKVDFLIIDTGPAHSSANDENDNRQAHEMVAAIRALMEALGNPATVALMHPPKGATRETVGTSRGGGAFSGSVDGLCGVWRDGGSPMEFFHCNKFRGPGFASKFFELQPHEFADVIDNFGEPAISIVAVPTEDRPKAKVSLSRSDRAALDALADCRSVAIAPPQAVLDGLPTCSGQPLSPPFAVAPEALWRDRFYTASASVGTQEAKKKAFSRGRSSLLELGLVRTNTGHYWLDTWTAPDFLRAHNAEASLFREQI